MLQQLENMTAEGKAMNTMLQESIDMLHSFNQQFEQIEQTVKTLEAEDLETELEEIEFYVLEEVENYTKEFTIAQLKKSLWLLNTTTTKQFETVLLNNGYKYRYHGKSKVKYFYREN